MLGCGWREVERWGRGWWSGSVGGIIMDGCSGIMGGSCGGMISGVELKLDMAEESIEKQSY